MKKILVTGGTGFIGKKIVELLSKKNEVFVITRNKLLKSTSQIRYVNANLYDYNSIEKAFGEKDIVVHLGAVMKDSGKHIFRTNITGTKNVVRACEKNKIKRLIFISSDVVFQCHKSAYAESKRIGEEEIKKIADNCILRPTVVYGRDDRVNLGKVIQIIKKHPIILIPGKGNNKMQPIYVEDVAKYISIAVEKNIRGTYILAGSDIITFNEFIDLICRSLNLKRVKIYMPLFIILPIAKLLEAVSPGFGISVSQIKNLNSDKVYDISETIKVFKYKPRNIIDCLKLTI